MIFAIGWTPCVGTFFDLDYSAANAYNIRGIPRTIFIDKGGNIIYDREGALNDEILETNIKKLIK